MTNRMTNTVSILGRLAEYTKFKRKQLGLTQKELADKVESIGIDNNYICRLENKRLQGMNIESVELLLAALDAEIKFIDTNE